MMSLVERLDWKSCKSLEFQNLSKPQLTQFVRLSV